MIKVHLNCLHIFKISFNKYKIWSENDLELFFKTGVTWKSQNRLIPKIRKKLNQFSTPYPISAKTETIFKLEIQIFIWYRCFNNLNNIYTIQ